MPVAKQNRSNTDSGLTFINVTHPNEIRQRITQKAIRSGAMAAIGRSRRKRRGKGKPVVVELDILQIDGEESFETDKLATVRLCKALKLQRIPPALPHLGIFAVEPDHRARELMHFMSGEAQHIYRPFRAEWFGMALLEPSSYFLCLANAALFMNQHVTQRICLEYTDSTESTWYYSKCLTNLTRQFDRNARDISEGAITTVLGFICHSFAIGKWERGEMHMQGLERIIRLRGGFQGLGDFSPLFASWFDITNSAVHDIPPRLPYTLSLGDSPAKLDALPSTLTQILSELVIAPFDLFPLGEGLRRMAQLAIFVNRHAQEPQFWEAGVKSTQLIGPVAHCILSIPRLTLLGHLDDSGLFLTSLLQEIVRLSLLILVAILKKSLSLAAHELRILVEKFSLLTPLMIHVSFFPELRLWAYIVAACARDGPISQSHLLEIRRAMDDLKLGNGEEAVATAKTIIWFYSLLDGQIEMVKEQIDYIEWI